MAVGGPFRLPQLGEIGLDPGAVRTASIILASGDSDGTPSASSDTDADIVTDTQETISIFNVKANTIVFSCKGYVETAFTASATINIGDSDDADGFNAAARLAATTTGETYVVDSDAPDSDDIASYEWSGGKFYAADQDIELVTAGADPAAGRLRVIVKYAYLGAKSNLDTST